MRATTSSPRVADVRRTDAALQTTIAWFGAIVAYAGIEHGVGEMLQGWRAPDALFIESWPDAAAFEIVSGEPALTVIPNLFLTGALTVTVSLALAAWALSFVDRHRGWLVLLGLSAALLLAGGGLAPPLMGGILSLAAWRLHAPREPVGPAGRRFSQSWQWFVAVGVAAYLGLVPGLVVASLVLSVPEVVVYVLGATAFGCLILALVAGRLADRAQLVSTAAVD
jgi:hypothetical protein